MGLFLTPPRVTYSTAMTKDSVAFFVINLAAISILFLLTCTCIRSLYINANHQDVYKFSAMRKNWKCLRKNAYQIKIQFHLTILRQILNLLFPDPCSVSMKLFIPSLVRNCFISLLFFPNFLWSFQFIMGFCLTAIQYLNKFKAEENC